jgi:hypothetical protein
VTIGNTAPTLEWAGTTGYVSDGVAPNKGAPSTDTFTFKVKYTDPDGAAPSTTHCVIRRLEDCRTWAWHTSLPLTAAPGGTWDTGRICGASTTLPNGVYAYRFVAADDQSAPATGDPTAWHLGPRLDAAPQLWCSGLAGRTDDFLHPNTGTPKDTKFRFSVQYTDGEGALPHVHRIELEKKRTDGTWRAFCTEDVPAWGGGARFGKYYTWQRKLPAGEYRYRFTFRDKDGYATGSDSNHADATQWQSGPIVTDATTDRAAAVETAIASLAATPSAGGAQITVSLTSAAEVDARVLNIAGRTVRTMCRATACEAGTNVLLWNAQSDSGLPVPSGTYLVEVIARAPDGQQSRALAPVTVKR